MSKRDRRTLEPIKTISIFSTTTFERVHKLDYPHPKHRFDEIDWSRPADFSLKPSNFRPAQRIAEPLAPTFAETELKCPDKSRSKSNFHYGSRNVAGNDPIVWLAQQQARPILSLGNAPLAEIPQNLAAYKTSERLKNIKKKTDISAEFSVTPIKRPREQSTFESATKRRAGGAAIYETPKRSADESFTDADDSFSRISTEQLLRMVDSGLVDTPEQSASPRVRSAAPGPSPRSTSVVYAYTATGSENSRVWTRQPNPWRGDNMPPPSWRPR